MHDFYTTPSYMTGGYLPIYAGARRHRGGGFLGSVRSSFSPLKKAFSSATTMRKRFVPIKRNVTSGAQAPRARSTAMKKSTAKARMKKPAKTKAPVRSLLSKGVKTFGKHLARGAKTLLKNKTVRQIGKRALQTGAEIGTQIVADALSGRHTGDSITERARQAALGALTGQQSSGIKRPSVQVQHKLKQRKRAATLNFGDSPPPGKRLRKGQSRARLNRMQLF